MTPIGSRTFSHFKSVKCKINLLGANLARLPTHPCVRIRQDPALISLAVAVVALLKFPISAFFPLTFEMKASLGHRTFRTLLHDRILKASPLAKDAST